MHIYKLKLTYEKDYVEFIVHIVFYRLLFYSGIIRFEVL